MKVSYNWLKQYVDFDHSPQELSKLLTDCGLEVSSLEKFQSVKGGLEGIVVGKVLSCSKHPNADKLTVTKVDIGSGAPLPIVCGAPNVTEGQKVLVATVGSTLYPEQDQPFPIKKAKIRGEASMGMICAEDELGLGQSHDGIMVLSPDAQTGKPASHYFPVEEDWTLEIDLTPNRADATSHLGVARDVVAVINQSKNNSPAKKLNYPRVDHFKPDNESLPVKVKILDTEACPRYSGVTLTGISVKPSPQWLENKLKAAGIRPVNNVVDATNYVMLETGQPLHPFDADKIEDHTIIIQKLKERTSFTTLDHKILKLSNQDLMICDSQTPLCIAGVFGGSGSGVTTKTTSLFLESAYFNPVSVRKTSKRHQLQTDASFRFERGADPGITVYALKRAAMLIREVAGGKISSHITDHNPGKIQPATVTLEYRKLDRLAGITINPKTVQQILADLEMKFLEQTNEKLVLAVPTGKVDVTRDVDIMEEVLRIYGYNHIPLPGNMQISLSPPQKPEPDQLVNTLSEFLSNNGFTEVMNNSLTAMDYHHLSQLISEEYQVEIINPLSRELNVMRQDLIAGGLENIAHNINRQSSNLRLYETGKVYRINPGGHKNTDVRKRFSETLHAGIFITGKKYRESWNMPHKPADFFDLKHHVEAVLNRLGISQKHLSADHSNRDYFDEGVRYLSSSGKELLQMGKISRKVLKAFDIEQEVFYADLALEPIMELSAKVKIIHEPLPRFPKVKRDLAMLLKTNVTYQEIQELAYTTERKLLQEMRLFDVYEGKNVPLGKKSYAISFILQDKNKTLTDKVIDKSMKKLQKAFEEKLQAQIRG